MTRITQNVGTWSDLPAEVLEDALYEPSSDDLLDLLLDYGQHLYTRDKVASRTVMAAYRRIAHLEKKLEALIEQRDEARRDAVEAEAYAIELEKQCESLFQAGYNNGQALILAEAKLALVNSKTGAY